ncbi:MAG: H4MPT-linked C1 transfer pathway protein [Methanomicrobiales archaeon]|nr:H4MPT-linked C1 transfer pathway protein [Methanomicrobiales archaeon]
MIGIDVGGANLKIVDDSGVHIHPCPLWKHAPLGELLENYRGNEAAVVMTGELADCFTSKMDGIRWIVSTVKGVFSDARFYGTDGQFYQEPVPALAAANWFASAVYLLSLYRGTLFVDMGSTTTDIVPLRDLENLKGLSDLQRLQKGYLVYHGLLRTSIPSFVRAIRIQGVLTPVSSENFALTADMHLILKHISTKEYTCETPDGRSPTLDSAVRRIARLVCADPEEVGGIIGVQGMADQIWEAEKERITLAVRRVEREAGTTGIVCAGTGGKLFAPLLWGIDLYKDLGDVAGALPAYAVREVALRTAGC